MPLLVARRLILPQAQRTSSILQSFRGEGLSIGSQTFYFPEGGGTQPGLTMVDPPFIITPRGDR